MANPRRVRLIAEKDSKDDGFDAELLARLGRVDPQRLWVTGEVYQPLGYDASTGRAA